MLRIGDWVKFYPLFPLAGAFIAAGLSSGLIAVFALFFCVTAYGFVINNLYDAEIDKRHPGKTKQGKNPFADGSISKREVVGMCAALVGIPLLASLTISGTGFIFILLCLIALTLYSAPPIRFKDRFAADIVCHGVMFGGLPFLAGYTLAGGAIAEFLSLPIASALVCTLLCCEALIIHEILDYHDDLGTTRTTIVGIGLRNGVFLLGITAVLSVVAFELISWWFAIDVGATAVMVTFLIGYPIYGCRTLLIPAAGRGYRTLMNNHLSRTR
ncbi:MULTISPECIES: UbiA prenyltransferase family protein [unclassified Methanoculleus]|uniref:UbiA prenyltransferase family protein n=2 Tax=Methanoculleus TaxID=45989 RepID=A0ABD8AB09_9EURY|nr:MULTISPECIES: UbiA prenyltransferase family protein [unclassified Methanoculleus]WOX56222.1 UbiA prenyltransferase family protein [Methanoculleus palmolei]